MSFFSFIQGVGIGASLIMPIGAQNAFLLNQGIKRNYHLIAATICVLCEICLVTVGVFGGAQLIAANDIMFMLITWGGILFLGAPPSLLQPCRATKNRTPSNKVKR